MSVPVCHWFAAAGSANIPATASRVRYRRPATCARRCPTSPEPTHGPDGSEPGLDRLAEADQPGGVVVPQGVDADICGQVGKLSSRAPTPSRRMPTGERTLRPRRGRSVHPRQDRRRLCGHPRPRSRHGARGSPDGKLGRMQRVPSSWCPRAAVSRAPYPAYEPVRPWCRQGLKPE